MLRRRIVSVLIITTMIGVLVILSLEFNSIPMRSRELSPLPTRADGRPQAYHGIATPRPDEKIYLGVAVEILAPISTATPPKFEFENEQFIVNENVQLYRLFVRDPHTHNLMRFGNDSGSAVYAASDEKYLIWGFLCEPSCQDFKQGLYAYDSLSGQQSYISEMFSTATYPKLSKPWMIYVHVTDPVMSIGSLYAYNLETGEHFQLASGIPDTRLSPTRNYIGVNDKRAYWVANNDEYRPVIHVFDFTTRTAKELKIPDLLYPQQTMIFEDYFVWFDEIWQGYSLQDDSYFTIPIVPPGWDATQIQSSNILKIEDGQLIWLIKVAGQDHQFVAPILYKR